MLLSPLHFLQKSTALLRRVVAVVAWVLPVAILVLLSIYLFTMIPNRYESETVVTLRNTVAQKADTQALPLLLGSPSSTVQELKLIQAHLQSQDTFNALDKAFNLKSRYLESPVEWEPVLDEESPEEDYLDVYAHLVRVELDEVGSLLTIKVQDSSAEDAQSMAAFLVQHAEAFTNTMTKGIATKQLAFSEDYLTNYEIKRRDLEDQLLALQAKYDVYSPESELSLKQGMILKLEGEQARLQLELTRLLSFMQEGSPQVQSILNQIRYIQGQINTQRASLTSKQEDGRPSELGKAKKDFERLKQDLKFWNESI
jgi:capsular polysaccharide transport system permease protein